MRRVVLALRVCVALGIAMPACGLSGVYAESKVPHSETAQAVSGDQAISGQVAVAGKAGWHTSFDTALAEAKSLQLPLLVHFYADWCGPCRSMETGVLNTAEVTAVLGNRVVAVKINADHRPDLMSRYGVAALPTDVFVSPAGETLSRSVGGATCSGYVEKITQQSASFAANNKVVDDLDPASEEQAIAKLSRLATVSGVGLEGYSPVALTSDRLWKEGEAKFAWKHAGVVYFMADDDELQRFRANPEKYAPRYSGFDPLILSTEGVAMQGNVQFGSFYEGTLFLHANEESRQVFIQDPTRYPLPREIQAPSAVASNNRRQPVQATRIGS